ncbi:MAG: hypothetical protein WA667_16800 [Candidatus Nitrosopolaris sp.]
MTHISNNIDTDIIIHHIFTMPCGGSIAVVHASIIGDFGEGYDAGKRQAYNDLPTVDNPFLVCTTV